MTYVSTCTDRELQTVFAEATHCQDSFCLGTCDPGSRCIPACGSKPAKERRCAHSCTAGWHYGSQAHKPTSPPVPSNPAEQGGSGVITRPHTAQATANSVCCTLLTSICDRLHALLPTEYSVEFIRSAAYMP